MTIKKTKKVPMRRCVGCMESKPKKELIRIVARGDEAMIDLAGKADGRGIYLCQSEACFEKARKKKSVTRGLGIENVGAEWYEDLKIRFVAANLDGEVTE